MVRALHEAGIEVILDVVYNHTAEGNHLGPTLSLPRASTTRPTTGWSTTTSSYYMDYTGTGNTLNVRHPHSLQLIMDSLRYWVTEMHVDGFRFDLAATLAREFYDVDRLSSFFELVQQDPMVSQVKLIAEPWDVGPGGYQVGNFPPQWTEWNGKYRDTVRDFWRGEPGTLGEFAARLTGSADLYEHSARRPVASINFVTAHDGFTLRDLVSYNEKHNEANGEDNNDGESHNRSWNCGVEGPTDDPEVLALRARQQRNFLATLLLSQGVPMICHGDELGRTQQGNNNGYCQDNELTWIDWDSADAELIAFTRDGRRAAPAEHPIFRRRRFFDGRAGAPQGRRGAARHRLVQPGRQRDDRGGLGLRLRPGGRGVPQRRTASRTATRAASGSPTTRSCSASTPTTRTIDFTLPGAEYGRRRGRSCWTPRSPSWSSRGRAGRGRRDACYRRAAHRWSCCSAERLMTGVPPTSSTYRLQIRRGFTAGRGGRADRLPARAGRRRGLPLADAAGDRRLRPRLRRHRPRRVDPDRGGEAGRLAAGRPPPGPSGLQVVVDIVPNHMGVADAGAERGLVAAAAARAATSRYADWFDVDWACGDGKVLLPVLGDGRRPDADLQHRRRRAALLRAPVPDRAGHLRRGRRPGRGARPPALPAGQLPAGRHRAELPPVLRGHRRWPACGWRTRRSSRPATPRSCAGSQTGTVDGIRIDHPDGLADPAGYLRRLAADAPDCWITVEKITEPGERLPADWPVAGTHRLRRAGRGQRAALRPGRRGRRDHGVPAADRRRAGLGRPPGGTANGWSPTTILQAELRRIGRGVRHAAADCPPTRPPCWPRSPSSRWPFAVYRSYQPVGDEQLDAAVALAGTPPPGAGRTIAALRPLLAGGDREVTVRFEQATGAIMAKGVEDTAYYRYNRAIGLNEVGGDPDRFGSTLDAVPRRAATRQQPAAGLDDHAVHPRHQAQRGRPGPAGRAARARRAVVRRGRAAAGRRAGPQPGVRLPALADLRRRRLDRPGPDARLRREGDAGGGRRHRLARPGPGVRAARCTRPSTSATTTPGCTPSWTG